MPPNLAVNFVRFAHLDAPKAARPLLLRPRIEFDSPAQSSRFNH